MSNEKELKDGLFRHGILTTRGDNRRGDNEGLGPREIKALAAENKSPWGQRSFRVNAIKQRARDAGHK